MRHLLLILLAFGFGLPLLGECKWVNTPKVVSDSPDTKYLFFEEPDNQEFWQQSSIPDAPVLSQYWQWVAKKAPTTDPFALLRRQREIFAKSGIPEIASEVKEFDLIINKKVGTIRRASCLELLLFAEHAKNFEKGEVTHEFDAMILVHKSSKKVRVYFASGKEKSGGAPSLSKFDEAIKRDWKQGFHLAYALHNHPFSFDSDYGDIAGTTIPSDADVASYINMKSMYNLEKAVITNGISSIELDNNEFEKLKKPISSQHLLGAIKPWSFWDLLAPLASCCCCITN